MKKEKAMRIDKFISDAGIASRRECSRAARAGQLLVDGVAVKDVSAHINPEVQSVCFMGHAVEYKKFVYVLLNKPEGYVSATEDGDFPAVTELLPEQLRRRGLFPVGRLDKDTLGVMLLTDDGKLAHSVLSPARHVKKVYRFGCAVPLAAGAEAVFAEGVTLRDGYECKSAELVCDADRMGGEITLTEGKYHQIKRMIASQGNRVTALERISFAGLPYGELPPRSKWRYLTDEEEAALKAAALQKD